MKKQLFGLGFLILMYFSSCITNERKGDTDIQKSSSVIDNVIVTASEIISSKLPNNSIIALFNNSTDENELTNYVIEQLHDIFVNKGSFKIVEIEKAENLEIEHRRQLSGVVPDDDIVSIVGKLGAQYVTSCYISGNGKLQRLRIKTWKLLTGETLVSSVYPTNELGLELANVKGTERQTIRESGITIDYGMESNEKNIKSFSCEMYIDGTQFYYMVSLGIGDDYEDSLNFSWLVLHSDGRIDDSSYDFIGNRKYTINDYIDKFVDGVSSLLEEGGADRRSLNIISSSLTKALRDAIRNL